MSDSLILVLIPTEKEFDKLNSFISETLSVPVTDRFLTSYGEPVHIEQCGFGPIASAASTMKFLAECNASRVVLAGIAGGFGDASIGEAMSFESVKLDDLGAQSRDGLLGPKKLGIPQWCPKDESGGHAVFDTLELVPLDDGLSKQQLLTVSRASGSKQAAQERTQLFPHASAEDMEAFGVALSCQMKRVPCSVVRGISNQVGNRDHRSWAIDQALLSVAKLLVKSIGLTKPANN